MKLNKRGFTLIELLAVIVVILAISVMAISSINSAIERNKEKQDSAKLEILKSYAELYFDDTNTNDGCVKIVTLADKYDLDDNDLKMATESSENNPSFDINGSDICLVFDSESNSYIWTYTRHKSTIGSQDYDDDDNIDTWKYTKNSSTGEYSWVKQ